MAWWTRESGCPDGRRGSVLGLRRVKRTGQLPEGEFSPLARPALRRGFFWRQFRKNQLAVCGGAVVLVMTLAALLASVLAPYDPGA